MAEHTPTPWTLLNDEGMIAVLAGNRDDLKNEVIHWTGFDASYFPKQAVANAAFIIRACNSHDALVEALREAELQLAYVQEKHGYATGETVLARIRSAIAIVDRSTEDTHG